VQKKSSMDQLNNNIEISRLQRENQRLCRAVEELSILKRKNRDRPEFQRVLLSSNLWFVILFFALLTDPFCYNV
jgi:hypothetical protein